MIFFFSKLLWILIQPVNLLLLALAAGAALLFTPRRRFGRALVVTATALLIGCAFLPIGRWLLMPLEQRFPPATLPSQVGGVIVLGGAVQAGASPHAQRIGIGENGERVLAIFVLAHRYPTARIVYAGGSAAMSRGRAAEVEAEAEVVHRLLQESGLDVSRFVFEGQSRNTYENGLYAKAQVQPRPGELWLLVTSAAHMPRSVGVFRRLGWPVVPYPVDYAETDSARLMNPARGLIELGSAAKEWVGLAAYRLLGYTDALFPAPEGSTTP